MSTTKDDTLKKVTKDYLETIPKGMPPLPSTIKSDILLATQIEYQKENAIRIVNHLEKWRIPTRLVPAQIADILLHTHHIRQLALAGLDNSEEFDILGIYQSKGEDEGLYITDAASIALRYSSISLTEVASSLSKRSSLSSISIIFITSTSMSFSTSKDKGRTMYA